VYSTRFFLSLGNVALSLVLGVAALILTAIFFPNFTLGLTKGASVIKERIVTLSGNPHYELLARNVLHESSILLMGFTLFSRVIVGLLITLVHRMFDRDA
jgi:hypothetical protein